MQFRFMRLFQNGHSGLNSKLWNNAEVTDVFTENRL